MAQKLPGHAFIWVKTASQSNKDFIENYNEDVDEEYSLEIYIH